MRKSIYTLLLLLCCTAAMAQVAPAPPITQFNQNSVYIENITKDRYLFHGKDALGHPIWTRIPFVLSPNTVISGLGMSVFGSVLTVQPGYWRITNVLFHTTTTTNFTLQPQDSVLSRYETVYADSANTLHIAVGSLSLNPVEPNIPSGDLRVGAALIQPLSATTPVIITQPGTITDYVFTHPKTKQADAYPKVRSITADSIMTPFYILPTTAPHSGDVIQAAGDGTTFWSPQAIYNQGTGILISSNIVKADTILLVTQRALLDTLKAHAAVFNPVQFTVINDTISFIGGGGSDSTLYKKNGTISDPLGRMVTISNSSSLKFFTPPVVGDSLYMTLDNGGFYANYHTTDGGTGDFDDSQYVNPGGAAIASTNNTTGDGTTIGTQSGGVAPSITIEALDGGAGHHKSIKFTTATDGSGIKFEDEQDGIGPIAGASIDTAKMSINDQMYITAGYFRAHARSSVVTANGVLGDGSLGTPVILGGGLNQNTTITTGATNIFQVSSTSGLNIATLQIQSGILQNIITRSGHGSAFSTYSVSGSDPLSQLGYEDNLGTGYKTISFGIVNKGAYLLDSKTNLGILFASDYSTNQRANLNSAASVKTVKLLIDSATATGVTSVFGRTGAVVSATNDYTFAQIGSKPTTLSGYGITDAYPLSGNPSSFLTANQSISFAPTGDVTGSTTGTTTLAPALSIGAGKVTNTMLAGSIDLTSKVTGLLPVANGGTGTASPGIVPGTNVTVTGIWPNQTVNSSAGSSYTFSTGLTNTSSTITNNLSVGVSGGQTAIGGTAVGDALSLKGTTGNGTSSAAAIKMLIGNNGATTGFQLFNNNNILLGNNVTTGSTTPLNVSFGATYGTNTPGNNGNLKWTMYDSGGSTDKYGIGMSSNLMEIQAGGGAAIGLYVNNGTLALKAASSGAINIPNLTASKVVFTDVSKNLTSTGIGTAIQLIAGDGSLVSGSITQGTGDLTAQTAAGNIATFTVGASTATFDITAYLNITAVATDVIETQVTYTDENNTAQTANFYTQGATSALLSGVGNSSYPPITIRAKNATVITVKTTLTTGGGSITFDAGARITQL